MAHPYESHRQGKLEHDRVAKIVGGSPSVAMKTENALGSLKRGIQSAKVDRITTAKMGDGATKRLDKFARGGKVKRAAGGVADSGNRGVADLVSDKEAAQQARENAATRTSRSVLRSEKGGEPMDRYARGGKVRGKGTNVNIIIGAQDKPPMPPAGAAPLPPPMLPGPAMPPGPPGLAGPGLPPGAGPMIPPMPPRSMGGRAAFAKGGKVSHDRGLSKAKTESMAAGTQVDHRPGKADLGDIRTTKPITYARGGAVPKWLDAGAGSGEGRLQKVDLQKGYK